MQMITLAGTQPNDPILTNMYIFQGEFLKLTRQIPKSQIKAKSYDLYFKPKNQSIILLYDLIFHPNKHCAVLVSCSDWMDLMDFIELHACDMLSKAVISSACQ